MLHRDKAVEQAIEKVRHSPDALWETLSPEERAGLKSALAEIWENCERSQWNEFCFSTLKRSAILELVDLVRDARNQHKSVCTAKDRFESILLLDPSGSRRH